MTLNLSIAFGQGCLVPGLQGFPHSNIFQPIPEAEVVIKDVVTTTWSLGLCRFPQPIVPRPDTFWSLHIRLSDSRDEIEGVLLVIFATVHGFVQLGNRRYEFYR